MADENWDQLAEIFYEPEYFESDPFSGLDAGESWNANDLSDGEWFGYLADNGLVDPQAEAWSGNPDAASYLGLTDDGANTGSPDALTGGYPKDGDTIGSGADQVVYRDGLGWTMADSSYSTNGGVTKVAPGNGEERFGAEGAFRAAYAKRVLEQEASKNKSSGKNPGSDDAAAVRKAAADGRSGAARGATAGALISNDAIATATKAQLDAVKAQRDLIFKELDPAKIAEQAKTADLAKYQSGLDAQRSLDPMMAGIRSAASAKVLSGIAGLGNGDADKVAAQATKEAMAGDESAGIRKALTDAAMSEIKAGGSLTGDIQAELVKAGLQRAGSMGGLATGAGIGGNIARNIIGTAGLQLRAERQTRAAALAQNADALKVSRMNVLASLFPNLKALQLGNLQAASGALEQANKGVPEVGLSGTDLTNLWMARVGANSSLLGQQGKLLGDAAMGKGTANAQAAGASAAAGGSLLLTNLPNITPVI